MNAEAGTEHLDAARTDAVPNAAAVTTLSGTAEAIAYIRAQRAQLPHEDWKTEGPLRSACAARSTDDGRLHLRVSHARGVSLTLVARLPTSGAKPTAASAPRKPWLVGSSHGDAVALHPSGLVASAGAGAATNELLLFAPQYRLARWTDTHARNGAQAAAAKALDEALWETPPVAYSRVTLRCARFDESGAPCIALDDWNASVASLAAALGRQVTTYAADGTVTLRVRAARVVFHGPRRRGDA